MLSSTDDAISVRDISSIGGVSIWPSAPAGGVLVSPGVNTWADEQGVMICPGSQLLPAWTTAVVERANSSVRATAATKVLGFCMVSP